MHDTIDFLTYVKLFILFKILVLIKKIYNSCLKKLLM